MKTNREIEISNSDDMIDVRDVIARIEQLEPLRESGPVDIGEDDNETDQDTLFAELKALEGLMDEMKGYGGDEQWRGDWYPISLIRDSYFVEAMQELCEDIGDMPKGFPHYMVIDWEATADNLRADYSSVEFDGVTYWYR